MMGIGRVRIGAGARGAIQLRGGEGRPGPPRGNHPKPLTLNPQPSTLIPELTTLNPIPSTLNP